jgi:SagB-type dehydrogenase family enzyme
MANRRTKEEVEEALRGLEYLRTAGGFATDHLFVSIYSSSTVVKTPQSVLRGRWGEPANDAFAGEELLLNFRTDNARMGFRMGLARFYEPEAVVSACHADLKEDLRDVIELPPAKPIRTGLTAVVTERRSTRAFTGEAISMGELSTLLFHCQGATGTLHPHDDPDGVIRLRTVASGGGLYPVTLYVHAFNVAGLAPGAYKYLPYAHAISPVAPHPKLSPARVLSLDLDVERSGFALTFVYDLYDNSRKYGDSGLVFGLIEVGAILQNLHLARTALSLAGCDQGGYDKQMIEKMLDLDGLSSQVVHVTVVGNGE